MTEGTNYEKTLAIEEAHNIGEHDAEANACCQHCQADTDHDRRNDEAKHTPGPWKVGKQPFGRDYMVTGPQSVGICDITHHVGQQCEADARLIAAAPDMLEELELLVFAFSGTSQGDGSHWAGARKVIAKAKATNG